MSAFLMGSANNFYCKLFFSDKYCMSYLPLLTVLEFHRNSITFFYLPNMFRWCIRLRQSEIKESCTISTTVYLSLFFLSFY